MTIIFLFTGALIITGFIFLLKKKRKGFLNGRSIDADAIILNIALTGVCIKNEIQAIIQVQVQPEMGKSFVGEVKEMLSSADYARVQPGTKTRIRYNPRNHKEMLILKENLSQPFKIYAEVV